jgi:hypothetical protein
MRVRVERVYGRRMEDVDVALRNVTYQMFVEAGRAPTAESVASAIGASVEDVLQGWARLHGAHALVLQTGGREIRMANPFSAVPTAYRVMANGRWWYANCAWDAFGVCAALHSGGTIETSCVDCGDAITIDVHDEQPDDPAIRFHCLVPASRWWDDIVFT